MPRFYGTATNPFYHQYPLQMFDRKVKTLSELFAGLVATKRLLFAKKVRNAMKAQQGLSDTDRKKLDNERACWRTTR